MAEPRFFPVPEPLTIADILALTGARLANAAASPEMLHGIASLATATPHDVSFVEGPAYVGELRATHAGACFCDSRLVAEVPSSTVALETARPAYAFALLARRLFPSALTGTPLWSGEGISPNAFVHPGAMLEANVTVEPFALVGEGAAIGSGTGILAGASIGPQVQIGRNCSIGAGATIMHALIGDGVFIHPGVRIGQDGFGFIAGRAGHMKVPQIGRVIIQDKVEIGANTTIDRGSVRDTIIGEGSKIDNLCQIAHNVIIGRHCVIAGLVGISGSVTIGDFVAIGGNCGIAGHLNIGNGASLAAKSGVMHDVPAGEKWIGLPAQPLRDWLRGQGGRRRRSKADEGKSSGEGE